MLSVPSELAASFPVQSAPAKAPRPESSQPTEQFASILDSSTPAHVSDATGPEQPTPAPAPRPADAAPAQSDSASVPASREPPSPNQAPRVSGDDRNSAGAPAPAANAPAVAASGTAQASLSGKSTGAKSGHEKPGENSAKDTTKSADQVNTQGEATLSNAVNAVAAAVTTAPAPAETPAPVGSAASSRPLAIAAAAIAATASTAAQLATSTPALSARDSVTSTASSDIALASGVSTVSAPAATTKAAVQELTAETLAGSSAPVKQSIEQAATAVETGIGSATAAGPATTGTLKPTPIKATASASTKIGAPSIPDATAATSAPPAAATTADVKPDATTQQQQGQQPASAASKQPSATEAVNAAKSDGGNINSAPTGAPASHNHASVAVTTPGVTTTSDAGAPSNATMQPPVALGQPVPLPQANVVSSGALTATAANGAPVPLSGLAVEIAGFAKSGKTRFDVRLDPADLGRIDVRIDVDRHGQVTSHLTVEKPETLSMLRQDAPQLQRALNDAGLKTGSNGLQFSLRDQSGSGHNNGSNAGTNAQRLIISEDDTVPASTVGLSYGRLVRSSGGVDIRV